MAMTNAERQQRYRDQRKKDTPVLQYRRPKDRRSRTQRWQDAVAELKALQGEYQGWLDNLPENLSGSATAEKLEAIVAVDLTELEELEFPRGFGRD